MPEIIKVQDQNDLVSSELYPFAKFPFEKLNPIQSRMFEFYNQDVNIVAAAPTSSGKTIVAELVLAHEMRERGGKGIYLTPHKALAQERISDWTDEKHHFSNLNISICTGDYRLTNDRKKELDEANLVILTTEMLNSRCRNIRSEKSRFVKEVGTLICDESHLLGVEGRGDHCEIGLMKFMRINPDARIVFLSATMPNVDEISAWLSDITGRDTVLLESKYRPCPLLTCYERCWNGNSSYEDNEIEKVKHAISIVESHPDDKFLIFAHTKRTGNMMKQQLQAMGWDCEFHNADLDKAKRIKLEERFKTDPDFKAVVATSTLAWGVNLPSRRVIVLGVHRGLSEVDMFDIHQMVGRAGRPQYDPCGDAYILLPATQYGEYKKKLQTPQEIRSRLLENIGGRYRVLAFHLVNEIHHKQVQTVEDMQDWFSTTLANHQEQDLHSRIVDGTILPLKQCGAIREKEGGKFEVTSIGKVASLFYYSPFDVADLGRNFDRMFKNKAEVDDYFVSIALGNIDTHRLGIVSKLERENMEMFLYKTSKIMPSMPEPAIKAAFAYHLLLKGRSSAVFNGLMRGLQFDFFRLLEVLKALDGMVFKWKKGPWFKTLGLRIKYGVEAKLVELCQIPNIGKVRAEKLWAKNIKTVSDVASNPEKVQKILNMKEARVQLICEAARDLL
jgi:helicase